MLAKRRGLTTVALVTGMALTAAACGGSSSGTGGGTTTAIKEGGTLHLLGAGDIDHMDPASAYYTPSYMLLRAISRQLVSYPNAVDSTKADTPVPDIATAIPTPTDGGTTYAFTIKTGVSWNVNGVARQVTGADAVLGFKRLCNPVSPTGALNYFSGVILGMKEFCTAFANVASTIPAIKAFVTSHEISGISASGNTVTIKLVQPAGDFLNILALPFASPMPVESLNYLPDSPEFRQNFISDGPYLVSKYTADHDIELSRNPLWTKSTDALRAAHVDHISIVEGSDEVPVQQALEAGTADMEWDTGVPTANIPGLRAKNDPNLALVDNGSTNPYVVINSLSPNANHALANVKVRQALNYAVNKRNIIQVEGGPSLYSPLGQILTPPILGYQQFDPYATPNSEGDPAKAKALLAEAGFPSLTLTFLYRNKGKSPLIAQTLQADLAKSGITLKLKAVPPADFYTKHLSKPAATKSGDWDLAAPGWNPDWQGNSARSFFVPLLDGRGCGEGSTNYNCYNNPAVNALIDKALAEQDQKKVGDLWHQADVLAMSDAPWVPIETGKAPHYHASRVMNWIYLPFDDDADITNVWLKDGK